MNKPLRVVFVQQKLTHYRESFLDGVKEKLENLGVDFYFVHTPPEFGFNKKNDAGYLKWARVVQPRKLSIFGIGLIWIPVPDDLSSADLLILTQENKLIANYYWLFKRNVSQIRIAFFGHGRNFQSESPNGLKEKWKKKYAGAVDWWFAYTKKSGEILVSDGYPADRISVINNAIDNDKFQEDLNGICSSDLDVLRASLKLSKGQPNYIGLFCGSLYADKRIDFMLAAADKIRLVLPGFVLVVIGDGPSLSEVQIAAQSRPWLHVLGAKKGKDKAGWFKLASVVFNPGAVGLHILDSFAAGVPMVTTDDAKHGPEIAYLENGVNGVITKGTIEDYSAGVISLLEDSCSYQKIRLAGLEASNFYTLAKMVDAFVLGVINCLNLSKK